MTRIVGFTGSRDGMTPAQDQQLRAKLIGADEVHHGDCDGSDKQCHQIAKYDLNIWTVGHPPTNDRHRAFCDVDELREEAEYLERDYRIVEEADEIIATPNTHFEVYRSGTWTTVRYAERYGKPVTIIFPDGSLEVRNGR